MKNKKYHNVRKIPKSNLKITERGQINAPETQTSLLAFLAVFRHFNKNRYRLRV